MGIPVSFSGIESKTFDPLPVGRYPAKVSGVTYNEASQKSGEPYVAWEFTVSEGEFANRKAFLNSSLQVEDKATGKKDARWATMRILTALGFTEEEVKARTWDFEDPEVVDTLMDRDCQVSIGHQMYEGAKQQRVRRVLSAAGEGGEKAPF
jgi:hypothetical protein